MQCCDAHSDGITDSHHKTVAQLLCSACRYAALLSCIQSMDMDELVMAIRRRSQGFTRGSSAYRGVTQHKSGVPAADEQPVWEKGHCVLMQSS